MNQSPSPLGSAREKEAISAKLVELVRFLPESCLVGVSGGLDSCGLLHALTMAGKRPYLLHFNHGWREDSDKDAEWVSGLAQKYGLPFCGGKASPQQSLQRSEQAARQARWFFFKQVAEETGCQVLVLAHQANDQVETFFLQLFRGSGSSLGGMRSSLQQGLLKVYRPWLGVWRDEISAYAQAQDLQWREDPSNQETHLLRNRIRHELLPYLEKNYKAHLAQSVWKAAEILGGENAWLEGLCEPPASQKELGVSDLRAMALGQQRRVIYQWLKNHQVRDLGFHNVEEVRKLLEKEKPSRVNLSQGRHVRRRKGKLFVQNEA